MMGNKNTIFDVFKAPLSGWNLVEASAGTGKTFSIALLVLRLMLEKGFALREILIVTFTKAATAELEGRIRKFIREAKLISEGRDSGNEAIKTIHNNAKNKYGEDLVNRRIKDAAYLLDEKSIFTIHGFCRQVLDEFAMETKQYFQTELVEDVSVIYNKAIFSFLRERINLLPQDLLKQLTVLEAIPMVEDLQRAVKHVMDGKQFYGYDEAVVASVPLENRLAQLLEEGERKKVDAENLLAEIRTFIDEDRDAFKKMMGYQKIEKVQSFFDNPLFEKPGKTALKNIPLYPQFEAAFIAYQNAMTELGRNGYLLTHAIIHEAIFYVKKAVGEYKKKMHLHTFNDFIDNLYDVLQHADSEKLRGALQERYKAVFVDEFQDTDEKQFKIFENIYSNSPAAMYFIGDPKQSIYAFRGGDVRNYLNSKPRMENIFSMNTNYRSSAEMIAALNAFLLPQKDFDTFYFENEEHGIEYTPVNATDSAKPMLYFENEPAGGLSIFRYKNKAEIDEAIGILVQNLLYSGKYSIVEDGKTSTILPADIALLCRKNDRALELQKALQLKNIASVVGKEKRIFESDEAKYFAYLIDAVALPSYQNIAKAMLSPFFNITIENIPQLDEDALLNLFASYKNLWQEQGAYPAMARLAEDFGLKQSLLANNNAVGEKSVANYYQLLEIINRVSLKQSFGIEETASWLYKAIENPSAKENEYLQRLETDEGAIRIETIHKSKGLEYKIVICPELDFIMEIDGKREWLEVAINGQKFLGHKSVFSEEDLLGQEIINEQENRRLLYVAVTRAVSHLFIFHNSYFGKGSLAKFMNEANVISPVEEYQLKLHSSKEAPLPIVITTPFQLQRQNWARLSYTSLAAAQEHSIKEKPLEQADAYENFVHYQLGRGNIMGTMLHEIFETARAMKPEYRQQNIAAITKKYAFALNAVSSEHLLEQMVDNVTGAVIDFDGHSFTLSDVRTNHQLAEMEFDFVFNEFKIHSLQQVNEKFSVKDFSLFPFQGAMNGKIDLFFEYNGKYYVLDWKSNYLGPNNSYYSSKNLCKAMDENNYHLQYYLYALAAKKYLSTRIQNFSFEEHFGGAIYIFLRGARKGKTSGIFTRKISIEEIELMESIVR